MARFTLLNMLLPFNFYLTLIIVVMVRFLWVSIMRFDQNYLIDNKTGKKNSYGIFREH